MRIFIDIGHPAHVHYSRNLIGLLQKNLGAHVRIIARDKEISQKLLKLYSIDYISRGRGGNSIIGKIFYLLYADFIILREAIKFKPDIYLSFMTPYPTHIAKIFRKKSIVITDTEQSTEQIRLFKNFANIILTPSCFRFDIGKKQIRINSFLELLYLHPKYFTPDSKVRKLLKLERYEKLVIVRFVSWNASHDIGHKGLTMDYKIKLVETLSNYARVFISSEAKLPKHLDKYLFPLSPDKIHDAIAEASLLYGESATMASEAACLGTYSIYHDDFGRGYTDELEKEYSIVFNFGECEDEQNRGLEKAIEILTNEHSKAISIQIKNKIIKSKIDFTAYLLKLIRASM